MEGQTHTCTHARTHTDGHTHTHTQTHRHRQRHREAHRQTDGHTQQTHLGTDDETADHAAPDDEGLQHVEAVEGGYEGILHFLIVLNGLVKVTPLQLLIAEVLDCLIVQQSIRGFGALSIVKAVQVPAPPAL